MKNFLEHLHCHKISPTCLSCGSYFRRAAFFCSSCFVQIQDKYQNFELSQDLVESIDVITQYRWVANASDSLSKTIHLLKLAEAKSAWRYLSQSFSAEVANLHRTSFDFKKTILVPVPGRSKSSTHTEFFSQSLSENLGIKTLRLLGNFEEVDSNKNGELQQKDLSRQQRLSRNFKFYVDFTQAIEIEKMQNIVLIDDVVTTGATLQACQREIRALKPTAKITAWVMFKRL